jgi:ABC-type transport system involved in multi-copper enzyme maturation permease subunit
MNKVMSIAMNTFREAIRDRLLYVIIVFAVFLISISKILGWVSMSEDIKIVTDLGLSVLSFLGLLIAVFIGGGIVHKEIDKRTIYTVISRPIARYQFVLGKYFGLLMTVFLVILVTSIFLNVYILLMGGEFQISIILAILFILMEMMVLTAVAVFLSAVSTPILSAVFTFCFYVIGHLDTGLKELAQTVETSFSSRILMGLYYVLPNLENFNTKVEAVHQIPLPENYFIFALGYCLLYTACILGLSFVVFEHKDF